MGYTIDITLKQGTVQQFAVLERKKLHKEYYYEYINISTGLHTRQGSA